MKFVISNKLNGSRNEFGLWKSNEWWIEQYYWLKIKAHAAKLINNFDIQNIDDFILIAKKFLSALLINSWFAFLGGYPRRGVLGSEDRQIKQMNNW